jgi:uncharacterized membrane protein
MGLILIVAVGLVVLVGAAVAVVATLSSKPGKD